MRNQRGITLVELLAAMVIVGFLTILIWRVFFQTIDFNSYAVTEQTLQQEGNIILISLQSIHTRETIKQIETPLDGSYLKVIIEDPDDDTKTKTAETFSRPGIVYQLYSSQPSITNNVISGTEVLTLQPISTSNNRVNFPIYLEISATDSKGRPLSYLLSTTLSKLTTD